MTISFIGAGNMATAIINSILNSKRLDAKDIFVFDKDFSKASSFACRGVNCCDSLAEVCNSGDYILLAVKPQDYEALLCDIKNCTENLENKIFISIAAAISCSYVCNMLGVNVPVIRVMPNTPLLLGVGATAISRNEFVSDKQYSKICTIFASSGSVTSLSEDMMNKVIAVNGSSPAYVYMFAKAMIDKAVEYGISEKNAKELVLQTLKGSVEMLTRSDKTPDELIKMVASPGGTTLAAIASLNNDKFFDIISCAMDACTHRAEELSR